MPYAALVSVLGAFVGTAFAMFGLQSWYAIKALALIGAALGLVGAFVALWRQELPLSASLDQYRQAARIVPTRAVGKPYLNIAFAAALLVGLVQCAVLLICPTDPIWVWMAGWAAIISTTMYQVWSNGQLRLPGKFDLLQIIGGGACLVIFGLLLVPALVAGDVVREHIPVFDLLRMTTLYATCVALIASLLAIVLANALHRLSSEGRAERV
jgi:1,4-dihydroxy-2-naphthoate octaprenyltransferase